MNVIVVGGGMVGCETAEFIWEESRGHIQVSIVEMLAKVASDVDPVEREFLRKGLRKRNSDPLGYEDGGNKADGIIAIDREQKNTSSGATALYWQREQSQTEILSFLRNKGMNLQHWRLP
jgi:pyruvate/2-oxoglutarate dehydrogenase complex dihydrolipoamide dehydrogenase (E3) component